MTNSVESLCSCLREQTEQWLTSDLQQKLQNEVNFYVNLYKIGGKNFHYIHVQDKDCPQAVTSKVSLYEQDIFLVSCMQLLFLKHDLSART